jgi:peptidyl-prolyl cis-trans isomerase D
MRSGFDARRFFSYFFILAIALVFVLQFGPGSRGCNAPLAPSVKDAAAKVNGKEIPLRDFRRSYAQRLEMLRQRGAGDFPESLARQFGIPAQVLDGLITAELAKQAAEREGITVSNEELREQIAHDPSFQKDGAFDPAVYDQVVRSLGKTQPDYEDDLRKLLAAGRLLNLVGETASVSEDELRARFQREGDTVTLSLVRFDPTSYATKIKLPTPAEVSAWEKAHGAEIAAYFQENKRNYSKGDQVRARHILIRLPRNATDADKKAAFDKANGLRKEIQGGKDFAEVARTSSDDPGSKTQGGELGWNERAAWVPAFSQAAFNLPIGEVSEPVLTPFGFHLIQVEEKKPAEEKPLASVSGEIAQILARRERARALADADARKALAALKKGTSLAAQFPDKKDQKDEDAAAEPGEKPQAIDTGSFARTAASVPKLGPSPDLQKDAFAADGPGPLPGLYHSGDSLVVAEVTARQKASDASFAAKKDALREQALRERQAEVQQSYLGALRKSATVLRNEELIGPGGEG